ncbi:MAG: adenylosuccinate lyase [Candidatus Micrarchaeota archaeon]
MAISPIEGRYKTEMNALFDEEARLRSWIRVEIALAHAHAKLGHMPKEAAAEIEKASEKVSLSRVLEIESEIHHDLMAMVKALSEQCPKFGGYVHFGATSYDIEDTALALVMRDGAGLIRSRLVGLKDILGKLALEKKNVVCVGRTHGQHAVPTTYGMKFALYYDAVKRHISLLDNAIKQISVGKMSGAVGTMATFGDDAFKLQEIIMNELALSPAPISCQVVGRERHAQMIFALATISSTLEQIAKEIRNLSRNEILEIAESFSAKQVGSSTMPHKRNPHKCERICSLARIMRSHLLVAMENISLEHERDLTNSANERFIIPESFILCDFMLKQMQAIISSLEFFPENIEKNLQLTKGAILAERIMIELTKKGMDRQEAHELMRESAKKAFSEKKSLQEILSEDAQVKKLLSKKQLEKLFDAHTYIGKANEIVKNTVSEK